MCGQSARQSDTSIQLTSLHQEDLTFMTVVSMFHVYIISIRRLVYNKSINNIPKEYTQNQDYKYTESIQNIYLNYT